MPADEIYNDEWAAQYQRRADAAIPGREGLYRLCHAALHSLPSNARILVVGCGTGDDLVPLATALPSASLVGIDPAAAMLALCALRVASAGLGDRITLHAGTLDTYESNGSFDAATSILVSQHIDSDSRAQAFFSKLAALLKPGGRLYTADLHIGAGQDRQRMLALWREQALLSGIEAPLVDSMLARFRSDVRPRDEATLLRFFDRAGFVDVMKPFSSLIYGAWSARKGTTGGR